MDRCNHCKRSSKWERDTWLSSGLSNRKNDDDKDHCFNHESMAKYGNRRYPTSCTLKQMLFLASKGFSNKEIISDNHHEWLGN